MPQNVVPVGTVISYIGYKDNLNWDPDLSGWLLCEGQLLPIDQYYELSKVIKNSFGAAPQGQFYLPDLRGMFLRGVDDGANQDPDSSTRAAQNPGGNSGAPGQDPVGSRECDVFGSHAHSYGFVLGSCGSGGSVAGDGSDLGWNESGLTVGAGGSETRPKNVYVYYLIYAGLPPSAK